MDNKGVTRDNYLVKRVLVTGGSGLVGSAIAKVINEEEDERKHWKFISSKDGDLRDKQKTFALFEEFRPNVVIHLAAMVGGLYKNMNEKVKMFTDNFEINNNVLQASANCKVEKLIVTLSTCIFPNIIEYPFDESTLHNGPPHPSNEGYAYSKRMLEVQCRLYKQQYGIECINIIPTNIFGPNDNFNLEDSHVIPGLIHKAFLSSQSGENLLVYGTGRAIRQFIYSIDLAKIIVSLVDQYDESIDPLIITSDDEYSISEVANSIANCFNIPPSRIEYNSGMADGQIRKTANNAKLKRYFPSFQFTPFDEAILHTCNWFSQHYDTSRR